MRDIAAETIIVADLHLLEPVEENQNASREQADHQSLFRDRQSARIVDGEEAGAGGSSH